MEGAQNKRSRYVNNRTLLMITIVIIVLIVAEIIMIVIITTMTLNVLKPRYEEPASSFRSLAGDPADI